MTDTLITIAAMVLILIAVPILICMANDRLEEWKRAKSFQRDTGLPLPKNGHPFVKAAFRHLDPLRKRLKGRASEILIGFLFTLIGLEIAKGGYRAHGFPVSSGAGVIVVTCGILFVLHGLIKHGLHPPK